MNDSRPEPLEERVLVLPPTARDAATSRDVLEAVGVRCVLCTTIEDVCREMQRGAGAAVVTAEAVLGDKEGRLAGQLKTQPPWSDFPLIVLTPPGAELPKLLGALEAIGPMTLMKRPVQVSTLVSTVRSALRDRRRQYAVRDLLDERRRAAETLREERQRYRVTLGSIGDAVLATDVEGRVTFLNPVAERLTGWDAAAARGRPLEEVFRLVSEMTRQPVQNPALRALTEGAVVALTNHAVLVARDATERPLDDSAAPIRGANGEVVGAVLVFRDMTEKRRVERTLREHEQRAAAILESITDAFFALGRDWRFTYMNRQAEGILRRPRDQVLGRNLWETFPQTVGSEFDQAFRQAMAEGVTVGFEAVYPPHDRWYEVHAYPSADGLAVYFRDVTERKKAEDALKEADRRKDDFLALLAHELRNPLAPLRNGLQVMRLAGGDANAVAQARGVMERQLGHMVRLIDDLLDVSRISRNKMELRRARVLLADVISNAVETARPAIEAAEHELVVALPAQPIFLDADLTRLAQVFSNLLTNSAKYTPHGGRIRLEAKSRNGTVTVTVGDTGIGIPAAALPTIFDMFSQVDRSIERSTGGLGIGLALVKGLVEMHGGTVAAASAGPGKGSTFTVTLPALASPPAPLEVLSPDSDQPGRGPKRRILVVDDNRDSAASMAMMLRLLGNEVSTAYDGIEAVEAAERFRPEFILMDVGMPRLNGLDAARRIREQAWGKGITIVALTGWGQDSDRAQSKEAGCDGHLVKPVHLPDLEQLLAESIGEARTRP